MDATTIERAWVHLYANAQTDADNALAAELEAADANVLALLAAARRTIAAFEALGRTRDAVAMVACQHECERAMMAQKEALTRFGGAA